MLICYYYFYLYFYFALFYFTFVLDLVILVLISGSCQSNNLNVHFSTNFYINILKPYFNYRNTIVLVINSNTEYYSKCTKKYLKVPMHLSTAWQISQNGLFIGNRLCLDYILIFH